MYEERIKDFYCTEWVESVHIANLTLVPFKTLLKTKTIGSFKGKTF